MATPKIKVAIVGGGMGGLCCAIALLKHSHLDVQVYEGAHKFSEIGAGVAFGPNAQRAFKLISPETKQAYLKLVTHNVWPDYRNVWFEYLIGMGPDCGKVVARPMNETGQSTVHRAKFLKEVRDLDKGGVMLNFKDGTSVDADCVIGGDGVHSVVRKYVLGLNHPALNLLFSRSVAYRGLIPMDEARASIGDRLAENSFVWIGKGGCVMTYPVDHGDRFNIVAINSSYDEWEGPWVQTASYDKIAAEFEAWGETPKKILKVLDRDSTQAWSMWDDPLTPTTWKGRAVVLGDAAHATTPFQGQGAGQAIEDAYVLGELFKHVDTVEKAPMAFEAYDRIRRPRSQRVTKTSREAGEAVALRLPGIMEDMTVFKEQFEWRMDWIWHRDIAGEADEAMICYEKLVRGESLG